MNYFENSMISKIQLRGRRQFNVYSSTHNSCFDRSQHRDDSLDAKYMNPGYALQL